MILPIIIPNDPAIVKIAVVDARLQVAQFTCLFAAYASQDVPLTVDFG
jgi:hypothetical protein